MHAEGARLWLVRHGETDWNVERRVQGHTPTSLNARGREQARELARFFRGHSFAAAYTSDLPRAFETAEIILEGRGMELRSDERLRERCLGRYQGMLATEVHAIRTAESGGGTNADLSNWSGVAEVESDEALWERCFAALHEISSRHAGEDVLVVSHGGVLGRAICESLGVQVKGWPRRFPLSNGMIAVLQWRMDAFDLLSLVDVGLVVNGKVNGDTSRG